VVQINGRRNASPDERKKRHWRASEEVSFSFVPRVLLADKSIILGRVLENVADEEAIYSSQMKYLEVSHFLPQGAFRRIRC